MDVKRLNLGKSPHIEIHRCDGNLEVRGFPRQDIALESDLPPVLITTAQDTALIDAIDGDCAIRMPEEGYLSIGSLRGRLMLKGVLGTAMVEHIRGDCVARHIGSLKIERIDGDTHLRHIGSPVTLNSVGGSATLRDIEAPITIGHVEGSFWGRNLPAGVHIEQIDGNLALHTDFAAGSVFQFATGGDVLLRVPCNANVRFTLPRKIPIQADTSLTTIDEGKQKIIVLGTGDAEVRISTASHIRIQSDETCDLENGCSFTFDGTLDAYMTDVSAKIDAQMSQIESRLNDLPGHIRTRVERKLEAAQRKVESTLRDAQMGGEGTQYAYCGQAVCVPTHEPVSEGERLAILRMLERGTITVQEAEKLLTTLEKGG